MKDMRTFTVKGDSDHHLGTDAKKVNHLSKYGRLGKTDIRDPVILKRRQVFLIKLTDSSLKPNQKALKQLHPVNSDMGVLTVPRVINAIKYSFTSDFSWKIQRQMRNCIFFDCYKFIAINPGP